MSAARYYQPAPPVAADAPVLHGDLCVYGGTAAGVIAAIAAARQGRRVVLLNPSRHLGGMTTGGLGYTDFGNKAAIGGLAREFYREVGAAYGAAEQWCFEPRVATAALEAMLRRAGVERNDGHYVAAVEFAPGNVRRLRRLRTTSGLRVEATQFIDCTYEGDLMAAAGVSYTVGREGNALHGETLNGQQVRHAHQFDFPVDPYAVPGDPRSGLLPGIDPDSAYAPGAPDRRVQAYNFRLCLTDRADIRVPFARPEGYRRDHHELLARYLAAGWEDVFAKFDRIPGGKTDTNNHGAVSTDFIGGNWRWPEAGYEERERIFQEHFTYVAGVQWFLANDPAVPGKIRAAYARWGLPADEFTDTGHWPHQLYVREARRLVGVAVMTEAHCRGRQRCADPVGLGAYPMDSHNCRRYVRDGRVYNEGDVQERLPRPYGVGYRALTPHRHECVNLLVPVAPSASHIAYGSIRMEPVFMVLAESAAIAAGLALDAGLPVQYVDYAALRRELLAAGQVLDWNDAVPNGEPNELGAPDSADCTR